MLVPRPLPGYGKAQPSLCNGNMQGKHMGLGARVLNGEKSAEDFHAENRRRNSNNVGG